VKKPVVPTRPTARKVIKVVAGFIVVSGAFLAGESHGESHAAAVTQASAVSEANAAASTTCSALFGTTDIIAAQFHSSPIVLDVTTTSLSSGHDVCAYRRPGETSDELVFFMLTSKPNDLVGKLGVITQTSVVVNGAGSKVFVAVVSTNAKVPASSRNDSWLVATGRKVVG